MLTVSFGKSIMSRAQVLLWYIQFKDGQEDVNGDDYLGRSSMSTTDENIEAVKKLIFIKRREMLLVMLTYRSAHADFSDVLDMKCPVAIIISKLLNFKQKQRCMHIAMVMLNIFNDDPDLLTKVITSDEPWVYGYDLETKAYSSQWKKNQNRKEHVKFGQIWGFCSQSRMVNKK